VSDRPQRLLIAARHLGLLRQHYAGVLDELLESGVEIAVVCESDSTAADAAALVAGRPGLRLVGILRTPRGLGPELVLRLRQLVDVLRYRHPDYAESSWLSERVHEAAPPGLRRWLDPIRPLGWRAAAPMIRLAVALDHLIPPWPEMERLLDEVEPDVVVVSPLVWVKSRQVDVLKAAARRGIPTAVWIPSWDNLTNKGLLRFVPDKVFVWNEMQRAELARYHRVPADRAVVTGAQTFDRWFADEGGSSREEFCGRLGLDPDRPYVLYLGSSRSIAPNEPEFFERWLAAVRSSGDPALEQAGVLIRPHPRNVQAWLVGGFERFGNVSVLVPRIDDSYSQAFYDEYGDAFRHSAVVVGINTSAMVEASIFGLPVCTPVLPEIAERQHGTLHFDHLVRAGGGLLHLGPSLEEHVGQLAEHVRRAPGDRDPRSDRFAEAFIRPHGLGVAAGPLFAEEMLRLFGRPTRMRRPGPLRRAVGRVLAHTGGFVGLALADHPWHRVAAWNVANVVVVESLVSSLARSVRRRLRRTRKQLAKNARRTALRSLRLVQRVAAGSAKAVGRRSSRSGSAPREHEALERERIGSAVEDAPRSGGG
jgi:hypothetical protein